MGTTNPNIIFNELGERDYYMSFHSTILPEWNFGKGRLNDLMQFVEKIKSETKSKEYNCIIGVSGDVETRLNTSLTYL